MSLVGFAVAGGRSRRMGRDKALLPWGGTDLLGHTLARLAETCDEVRILPGSEPRYGDRGLPEDPDVVSDAGPLGGLLTALERAGRRSVLLLGVDLPLVPAALLAHLAGLAPEGDAVVPVSPHGPEPVCAVYRPACREPARWCAVGGHFQMTAFWSKIRVREVGLDELAAFGDPEELFLNANSLEDYERARALAG